MLKPESWAIYIALTFFGSALLALRGTNTQARMAKRRWLSDKSPAIVKAAQLWAPGPRWIRGRKHVAEFKALEATIKKKPADWTRYTELLDEFKAWNDLETAVALAAPASLIGAVLAVAQSVAT